MKRDRKFDEADLVFLKKASDRYDLVKNRFGKTVTGLTHAQAMKLIGSHVKGAKVLFREAS